MEIENKPAAETLGIQTVQPDSEEYEAEQDIDELTKEESKIEMTEQDT